MSTIAQKGSSWNAEDTILVDNVTALKNVVKLAGIVWIKGYTSIGDGGYGSYCYDATVDQDDANDTSIVSTNDGTGLGCWIRNVSSAQDHTVNKVTLLDVKSYTTQEPSGTDVPLQLTFGNAQGNPAVDPVTIDALGAITFHTGGRYSFSVGLEPGRANSAGTAIMYAGWLINGVPAGNSVTFKMSDANYSSPFRTVFEYDVPAGTIMTMELVRDSTGNDSGGVFTFTPTLAGRLPTPSTSMVISEFTSSPV